MKAVRDFMRKLGLISEDETPSEATLAAYHKMYESPMTNIMIEAVAELYGWTLSTIMIHGLFATSGGSVGWSPHRGVIFTPPGPWVFRYHLDAVRT
jgi:hypothetical protein